MDKPNERDQEFLASKLSGQDRIARAKKIAFNLHKKRGLKSQLGSPVRYSKYMPHFNTTIQYMVKKEPGKHPL